MFLAIIFHADFIILGLPALRKRVVKLEVGRFNRIAGDCNNVGLKSFPELPSMPSTKE